MAKKTKLVSSIITRLLTEKQVEFGDQRLYFKEMIRELEHPLYPEVVAGWTESEAHILSVTDTVGDYSLHEPPILQKKRIAATNENPGPAASRVMELLELLDRRQLQNQSVRIIRYKQSATQGRNLIISSTASSGMLRTMLINRLNRLNLDLSALEYDELANRLIDDANSISGDLALRAAKRGRSAYELMGVVLSRFLIRHEFSGDRYFGWYFLDDYAEWLGQREEQIADLMIVSPEETDEGLLLSIIVSESKYIDEASLASKRKESQKQLRDTVRRIHEALFGNPDRLDRELWLARLSDLVLDGVLFSAGQSPQVSQWRRDIRAGNCKIMRRGYSHVFVHSADFSDSNTFPLDQVQSCHQEVFARKELRDLLLAYWRRDDPTFVRNREFDYPPANQPHEFQPPTAVRKRSDIVKKAGRPQGEESKSLEQGSASQLATNSIDSNVDTPTNTTDPDAHESFPSNGANEIAIESADILFWSFDGLSSIVEANMESRKTSDGDTEWLKQVVKQMKTGLQQYNLQAKLKSETMTPNAALLKFEGSSHLTVDQVTKRQSEFLTTHGLNIISVQPEPGIVSIAVARPQREVVNLADIWKRSSPPRTEGNQSVAIAVQDANSVESPMCESTPLTCFNWIRQLILVSWPACGDVVSDFVGAFARVVFAIADWSDERRFFRPFSEGFSCDNHRA